MCEMKKVAAKIFQTYAEELAQTLGVSVEELPSKCAQLADIDFEYLANAQNSAEARAWTWAQQNFLPTDDEVAELFIELRYQYGF